MIEEYFKVVKKVEEELNDNDDIIGLIVASVNNESIETCEFKAPKRGRISELIVSKKVREAGIC